MRFIATFEHSLYLEKAIATIESLGVAKEGIFAAPLDKPNLTSVTFDTLQHSDGKSLFDGIALLGGLGCALGSIYGFVLPFGPVFWGIIGFVAGIAIGALIKWIQWLIKNKTHKPSSPTEVVLMIECHEQIAREVEDTLWRNGAFGVAGISGHRGRHEAPANKSTT